MNITVHGWFWSDALSVSSSVPFKLAALQGKSRSGSSREFQHEESRYSIWKKSTVDILIPRTTSKLHLK